MCLLCLDQFGVSLAEADEAIWEGCSLELFSFIVFYYTMYTMYALLCSCYVVVGVCCGVYLSSRVHWQRWHNL